MPRALALVITAAALCNSGSIALCAKSDSTALAKLAEQGDPQAQIILGIRYRDGTDTPQDYQQALKWFRRCADTGNAEGMDNLGYMYLRGWGVPEDFNIAAAFFRAAAAKDHARAKFNLGNCYFSGQGVEQDYLAAVDFWQQAADTGHREATWRLAVLYAAGEGVAKDREKAQRLCRSIAEKGHVDAMLLLGELHAGRGETEAARRWWKRAADKGSEQAHALLDLSQWLERDRADGTLAYVDVDHLYQGWNNCGATTVAMFLRHAGIDTTPYALKRLCPRAPIGTGTDWADLVAAGEGLGLPLRMQVFSNDDAGFAQGVEFLRGQLNAGRPVVIDFTVTRQRSGKTKHFGHTLLLVGYHAKLGEFVLKNPNQPSPGIQLMTAEELKENWYSRGYSRLAKGQAARPVIVQTDE